MSTAPLPEAVRRRVLALLTLWFCMALIDIGIVNVALPSIQHDLGATASDLQWVLSGYALTFGAVLIAAGRAGDILGRGGVFLIGLAVFTAASLAAALAPTPTWLNTARFIEGVGAGAMSPQVYGIVQEYFRGAERGRAFGLLGMAASLSVAIAPPLGGALIALGGAHWGWRLTFLINVPLGIVGIVLACLWFPKPILRLSASSRHGKHSGLRDFLASLDVVGSTLAALAVLALLYPFVEFHATRWVWFGIPVALAAIWAWVAWEAWYARTGHPAMVDLSLFKLQSFTNGLTIQTVYFLGMTSVWVLVALYAQEAAHMSAFATGLLGVPSAIISAASARWAGQRVVQSGRQLVVAGQTLAVCSLALTTLVIALHAFAGASLWWIVAPLALYGLGQGAAISPNQTLTLEAVPVASAGSSGALVSTSQRVGASIGIAIVTGTVFAVLPHTSWGVAAVAGFMLIMLLMTAAIIVGMHDLRCERASRSAGAPVADA